MQCSGAEEILGGSIYDPAYYTSLFEETETNLNSPKWMKYNILSLEFFVVCVRFFVSL
ncbi:hypothetical protein YC2023_082112 [Brassica napus]